MERLKKMIRCVVKGISHAVLRFPFTIICLAAAASLICYTIYLSKTPPLTVEKLIFTFFVGAILGMAAEFGAERFSRHARSRLIAYALSVILTAGYFLIIWPAPEIGDEIGIRTFVAVFSLICAVLWFPSYKGKTDFNKIALIHFKSVFIAVLYAAVLSGGIAAIIAAVDILLFEVDNDAYAYTMTLIWVLFMPVYYLSLLPVFGSEKDEDIKAFNNSEKYPRVLEILVSYIAIPLVAAYTLVLFTYFIKILFTKVWPSGQLGPMVLFYSAAGLIIFVLASPLDNRFSLYYRKIFPKALIPVVVMQLISVGIRLRAYGVTESRYYVALFGAFSILTGLYLSFKPGNRNNVIALLAAAFAVFSVIPPFDAFTVSRNSQIGRLENILESEGILMDSKLTPKTEASLQTKIETTSILNYLDSRHSLKYIAWLPEDFGIYEDMLDTLGFEPAYSGYYGKGSRYFYFSLNAEKPVPISGYDVSFTVFSNRFSIENNARAYNFTVRGENYTFEISRQSSTEARAAVKNAAGTELVGSGLFEFAAGLIKENSASREALPPERMTLEAAQNGCRLKIVFQNISITESGADAGADYSMTVLFGAPQ